MGNLLPDKDSVNKDGYSPEYIVLGWLDAATNFHRCYTHVITYASQHVPGQDLRKGNPLDTSQFPIGQLHWMLIQMRREVEMLAQDMGQGRGFTKLSVRKSHKKLATHTLFLNRLTYQAQLRLDLVSRSAS